MEKQFKKEKAMDSKSHYSTKNYIQVFRTSKQLFTSLFISDKNVQLQGTDTHSTFVFIFHCSQPSAYKKVVKQWITEFLEEHYLVKSQHSVYFSPPWSRLPL